MSKFSLNPLHWVKKKPQGVRPSASTNPVLKPPAQPRKSGNIFLHLVTLQKNLQSVELALGQGIDTGWLMQKAASQTSLLKLEAEKLEEEELAQSAGQVLALFETVSEGRLVLDNDALELVRSFTQIFKDALGDAAPGVRPLDTHRLERWESSYQSLMARMKPIEQEINLVEAEEFEIIDQEAEEAGETAPSTEDEIESVPPTGATAEAMPSARLEPAEGPGEAPEEEAEVAGKEGVTGGQTVGDDLPAYDPAQHARVRDVAITDAEIKSAREYMELGESKPNLVRKEEEPQEAELADEEEKISRSPVQLEEVEQLKRRLLELHEKQEMLSSRMSGILGGIKKVVDDAPERQRPDSIEKLEVDELEDLIFIGRKKG